MHIIFDVCLFLSSNGDERIYKLIICPILHQSSPKKKELERIKFIEAEGPGKYQDAYQPHKLRHLDEGGREYLVPVV